MSVAQSFLQSLELAGVACEEFAQPLQEACVDASCTAVLKWLTSQVSHGLLSDNQAALLHSLASEHAPKDCIQAKPAGLDHLITAVQQEQASQTLLQASPSESRLQEISVEAVLLQMQEKLKSLQALTSLINKQTPAGGHALAARAHCKRQARSRLEINAKRLTGQQAAMNTLLAEISQTTAALTTKFDQHNMGWLLGLSDLQALHQQDAAFQLQLDK